MTASAPQPVDIVTPNGISRRVHQWELKPDPSTESYMAVRQIYDNERYIIRLTAFAKTDWPGPYAFAASHYYFSNDRILYPIVKFPDRYQPVPESHQFDSLQQARIAADQWLENATPYLPTQYAALAKAHDKPFPPTSAAAGPQPEEYLQTAWLLTQTLFHARDRGTLDAAALQDIRDAANNALDQAQRLHDLRQNPDPAFTARINNIRRSARP